MKKIIISIALVALSTITSVAQIAEGHVAYKIDISTDEPDMQMVVGMMQNSSLDIYFKEKSTRAEMKMGTMMTMTTITNEKSNEMLMLMGGMVGNNAILTNLDELDAQKATEKPSYTVELIDEKKTIADYSCSKAILTDEDGNEMVFWYTDQIEISKKGQNYLYEDVPGFPMEYVINNKGLKMAMTVTKIDQKLDKKSADLFDMKIPSGYKEMTLEDLKKLGMGGM